MLFSPKFKSGQIAIATASAVIVLSGMSGTAAKAADAQPAAAAASAAAAQAPSSDAVVDAARDAFMDALRLEEIREDDKAVAQYEHVCQLIRSSPNSFSPHFKYRVGRDYSRLLLRHQNRDKAQPIEDEFCQHEHHHKWMWIKAGPHSKP